MGNDLEVKKRKMVHILQDIPNKHLLLTAVNMALERFLEESGVSPSDDIQITMRGFCGDKDLTNVLDFRHEIKIEEQ